MEIYFDDKLINEDYYTELSTNFALFSDTFYLGSTASNTYNISIAKEGITTHPNTVLIKNNGELIATLVVDNVEENDFEYKYTLTDKMVNLEFNYDASEIFNNGVATLLEIVQDICYKAGIELATMDFRGYDKGISWYDNTRTAREYIGYIAELNGGYAQIGKDGKLYFRKQNTSSAKSISIDDCADFKIGEKHVITRVVYEQGTLKYEYGNESGNTLYLSGDNVYITEQIEVEEIFNEINGFEFYSFSTSNCPIDYNIMAGQIITFTDDINNYPTIVGYELNFNGDWYGGYNLDVATKKQEETKVVGTNEKIKNLDIKVDRESNKITQLAEKTTQIENDVTNNSTDINNNYQDIIQQLGEYAKETDVIAVKESVQTIQDEASYAIEVVKKVQTDGVDRVTTTTGYTFDEDGLTIEKTDAKTKSILNETGLDIKDATGSSDQSLLFAGYDETSGETIVKSKNMTVEKYLVIGKYSRMEDFKDADGNLGTRNVLDRRIRYGNIFSTM